MSTEFTRESSLLPMNRIGNNLCSFSNKDDVCHLYINNDKTNIHDFILTLHLMESGRNKELDMPPIYSKVHIKYWPEDSSYVTIGEAIEVPYEYFEKRDQRHIFRATLY